MTGVGSVVSVTLRTCSDSHVVTLRKCGDPHVVSPRERCHPLRVTLRERSDRRVGYDLCISNAILRSQGLLRMTEFLNSQGKVPGKQENAHTT